MASATRSQADAEEDRRHPHGYLQYVITKPPLPASAKFLIVLAGTLSLSWALTLGLRRIPLVARMTSQQ